MENEEQFASAMKDFKTLIEDYLNSKHSMTRNFLQEQIVKGANLLVKENSVFLEGKK